MQNESVDISAAHEVKVAILLCTYNGQRYLAEQLDSFSAQDFSNWEVWVSDDGSKDDTFAIIEDYQRKWPSGRLHLNFGPSRGFAANFLALTCNAGIESDYYAYSDQDDIWEAGKLERAVRWLMTISPDTPALYCSRTILVDEDNNETGLSPLFSKTPGFANALVQNIAGGNTMVFNDAACRLLRKAGSDISVVAHDWWVYMVVAGCGGTVFYDSQPSVRYRQHESNIIGMKHNWFNRLNHFRDLWHGLLKGWNDSNIEALSRLHDDLTPGSRKTLERFSMARQKAWPLNLVCFKRSGIYRQSFLGTLGLFVAAVFKKI